jgi:hypothetical protein
MNQAVHEIGGRKFTTILVSTAEHDFWTMRHVREAKLDNLFKGKDETPEAFCERLLNEVIASGKAFLLLGAMLIEEGKRDEDWTPDMGESTAAFLSKLTAPADKFKVQTLVIGTLVTFFRKGLGYSNYSRTSLTETHAPAQPIAS